MKAAAWSCCAGSVLFFPLGSEKVWHALGFAQKSILLRSLTKMYGGMERHPKHTMAEDLIQLGRNPC